jgi:hypothetical protein
MENPLSKLDLDDWYQVLMVVCVIVFLLAGAGILKAFPVAPTAAVSAGGFFVGLGEWINHPLQVAMSAVGVAHGHPRKNSPVGILFLVLGIGLIGFGIYRIVR